MSFPSNLSLTGADAARNLISNSINSQVAITRLSSGSRINSSADDASALAVSNLLRADVAQLRQASNNISDGISMVQTADGAAQAINDNLVRMKELATQASSSAYSAGQKTIMQEEFSGLEEQISQITSSTNFNGVNLYESGKSVEVAIGDGQSISIDTESISVGQADLTVDAKAASAAVDAAITQTSAYRGNLGAKANALEKTAEVLDIQSENLLTAQSRISDADIATEVASNTVNKIMLETAVAAQVYANTVSETAVVALMS